MRQTVEQRFTRVSFGMQENCTTDFIEIHDVARASAAAGGGGKTFMTTRFCGNVSSSGFNNYRALPRPRPRRSPGLVNFVTPLAYHFCLA